MIIFLYGEDKFRLNEKLKQLKEEFFKKNTSNATSSVFDFDEGDFNNELRAKIKSKGLFSEKALIVVKNFLNQKDVSQKNKLVEFLEDNLKDISCSADTIIFLESENFKKSDKFFKWLVSNVKNEEFLKLNDAQLRKWIDEKFRSSNIKISSEIADKLIVNKNGDLFSLDKEILKIINFIGKSELDQDLSVQIDKLINSTTEANIFKTIEFISSGDKRGALEMLHKQLEQGDDPFYILSMYIYQFRNLLKIAEVYFQGNSDYKEVAKIIKIHPFVVQKGMQQLKGFDYQKLKEIYQKLEKVDQDVKTGKTNIGLGLDLFVANL